MQKTIIISSNDDDFSTNEVIEWALFYGAKVIRINERDEINFVSLNLQNNEQIMLVQFLGELVEINKNTIFWYRRGHINFQNQLSALSFSTDLKNFIYSSALDIKKYIYDELDELSIFTNTLLGEKNNKNSYGAYSNNFTVKLENLLIAKNYSLLIPKTIVATKKQHLLDFYHDCNKKIITKAIRNGVGIYEKEFSYEGLTVEYTLDDIEALQDEFYPTLFQEKIDKLLEVRSFYFEREFYSSAIFSQKDDKTKTDFRNYNELKPNRTPPFKLPNHIEKRLVNFLNHLEMKTGSVDLVINKMGEYIFLEVNPIGQFTQVSRPCNYYIEDIIAKKLIES